MLSSSTLAAAAVAVLMLVFGAWQHLVFSYSVGEPAWFKNAYDEDTYILLTNGLSGARLDRTLSDAVARLFLWMTGGSPSAALVAFDLVFPPLVFLSGYFLAARLFARSGARTLLALLLMFSADFFSLGNSASYLSQFLSLEQFKAVVARLGPNLVPPIETSFPTVLRSPEPQVVYVVGFLFMALLIDVVRRAGRVHAPTVWVGLAAMQVLLTLSYSLVAFPLLLVEGFAVCILLGCRAFRAAALLAVLCAASAGATFAAYTALGAEGSRVFASRLPTISTAVLGGAGLLCLVSVLLWKRGFADRMLWLAAGFAGLPVVLMNQQLLTGVMLSARDWERYVNHPALIVGLGLYLSALGTRERRTESALSSRLAIVAAAVVLLIAFASLRRATTFWFPTNTQTLAMAKAIDAAPDGLEGWTLVLEAPDLAPALAVRRHGERDFLIDYTDVVLSWIPALARADFRLTPHGEALFEYWRLRGLSTSQAAAILQSEIAARSGYYSAFFFNICDYWYPCTDGRAVPTSAIEAHLPEILAAYERFRTQPAGGALGSRRYAFVSLGRAPINHEVFGSSPVSSATVGGVTASVWLQTGESAPPRLN